VAQFLDDQEAASMLMQELAMRVHSTVSSGVPEAPPSAHTIVKLNKKGEAL
jgi:hypothetical protein